MTTPGRESPGPGSGSATPTRVAPEDDDSSSSAGMALASSSLAGDSSDMPVFHRYPGMQGVVEHLVMEAVRDQLGRRQAGGGTGDNITRNFIRFLTAACGLTEVIHTSRMAHLETLGETAF